MCIRDRDIAVDIHGIKCLFQLDNHVFYQFLVQKVSVLKDTLDVYKRQALALLCQALGTSVPKAWHE